VIKTRERKRVLGGILRSARGRVAIPVSSEWATFNRSSFRRACTMRRDAHAAMHMARSEVCSSTRYRCARHRSAADNTTNVTGIIASVAVISVFPHVCAGRAPRVAVATACNEVSHTYVTEPTFAVLRACSSLHALPSGPTLVLTHTLNASQLQRETSQPSGPL